MLGKNIKNPYFSNVNLYTKILKILGCKLSSLLMNNSCDSERLFVTSLVVEL